MNIYHDSKARKAKVGLIKKIKRGVLLLTVLPLLAIAGGAAWYIGGHTLVRTEKEYVFVQKEKMGFENNYVDIRNWTIFDYLNHQEITQALIEKGYQDIKTKLENSGGKAKIDETVQKAGDALKSLSDKLNK
jgi:hypothetical protein